MPFVRRSAPRRKFVARRKRPYKKRYFTNRQRLTQTLQPNRMLVKLRFAINDGDSHVMTSTTGSVTDYTYRANGMYDPYASAGGAQPRGYDQYMSLYRNFTVIGSKIHVTFFHSQTGTVNPVKCAIILNDATTSISGTAQIGESPRSINKMLLGDSGPITLRKGFSAKKFFGIKNPLDEDDLSGTASADPAQAANFHICAFAPNAATQAIQFTGFIDYIAVLHSPIIPTQS